MGWPQKTSRQTRNIASIAANEAMMIAPMATQDRASPAAAAAKMSVSLPHRPENGGKPITENAPAAKIAAVQESRRMRPDSFDRVPVP